MAKTPGKRGKKAPKSAEKAGIKVVFGVASGKRNTPDRHEVRFTAGKGGINLPNKLSLVRRLALDGYEDEQIARIAGVSLETLEFWNDIHPDMKDAIESGRTSADAAVVESLFKLATGFTKRVEEVHGKDADRVQYKKYYPPEISAIKTWLRMRKNARFKEDPVKMELTGKGGKDLMPKESKADIINSLVAAVRPRDDNEKPKGKKGK